MAPASFEGGLQDLGEPFIGSTHNCDKNHAPELHYSDFMDFDPHPRSPPLVLMFYCLIVGLSCGFEL